MRSSSRGRSRIVSYSSICINYDMIWSDIVFIHSFIIILGVLLLLVLDFDLE